MVPIPFGTELEPILLGSLLFMFTSRVLCCPPTPSRCKALDLSDIQTAHTNTEQTFIPGDGEEKDRTRN